MAAIGLIRHIWNNPGSYSFKFSDYPQPAGPAIITCGGSGSGGILLTGKQNGQGGGGGALGKKTMPLADLVVNNVTIATQFTVVVGLRGVGHPINTVQNSIGQHSIFESAAGILCKGDRGYFNGIGGKSANCVGDIASSGGDGTAVDDVGFDNGGGAGSGGIDMVSGESALPNRFRAGRCPDPYTPDKAGGTGTWMDTSTQPATRRPATSGNDGSFMHDGITAGSGGGGGRLNVSAGGDAGNGAVMIAYMIAGASEDIYHGH